MNISEPSKHIIIIAGESSGDLHASHLIKEIKNIDPTVTFSGFGGPLMEQQGVHLYRDLTKISVVGFIEVLKHYSEFKKAFKLIINKINKLKPHAVILVDYPGFNLRLAKKINRQYTKVIYYISPQVWAWKKDRIFLIKKYIDKMLVLFQFEKEFFDKYKVKSIFVGHPLLDLITVDKQRDKFFEAVDLPFYKLTIGILPGSRQKEIERHLPIMIKTSQILREEFPMIQFVILKAPSIDRSLIDKYANKALISFKVVEGQTYDAVNACDLCMVSSGTATLEVAILQKPMVIIYKTSLFTWLLAKLFVTIPHIGLVNVVAGKKIVPEFVQFQAKPEKIANALKEIFTNEIRISEVKSNLSLIKELLGSSGASKKAAEEVIKAISN